MSNATEKMESNDRKSKPKGETDRSTLTDQQGTTGGRKEKDSDKAKKEIDNTAARDPHIKYFTRLGIVHKSETLSQNYAARHSLHAGHHRKARERSKNSSLRKPRRAATVLNSTVSSAQEGGGYHTHQGAPTADLPLDVVQPLVPRDSSQGVPLTESLPSSTEAQCGANVGEDLSATQSDQGVRAPVGVVGNGITRSASAELLWTPSMNQPDAQQQLPYRNKWLSMTTFPPSVLSPNRFISTGLEQIQNETASVNAGLLVEPGVSKVHVHHRPRVRSSSQPPKSGGHYMKYCFGY